MSSKRNAGKHAWMKNGETLHNRLRWVIAGPRCKFRVQRRVHAGKTRPAGLAPCSAALAAAPKLPPASRPDQRASVGRCCPLSRSNPSVAQLLRRLVLMLWLPVC